MFRVCFDLLHFFFSVAASLMLLLSLFLSPPVSRSRVYLVAQERQDGVSNWLCVQVTLPQLRALQHHLGRVEEKNQRSPPRENKGRKKERVKKEKKRQSSQKNNNCCTIIQTSYNCDLVWFVCFHVSSTHLSPSSVTYFLGCHLSPFFVYVFFSWPLILRCVSFIFVFSDLTTILVSMDFIWF